MYGKKLEYQKHLDAIKKHSWNLYWVPEEFKTKELCVIAIEKDGYSLEFVPEELKTKELCELATKICCLALKYVPEELRTKEMCKTALDGFNKNFNEGLLRILKELIPEKFHEEFAEKYDIGLLNKSEDRVKVL